MSNAAIAFPAVQSVRVDSIDESPSNPRRTFTQIEELAEDIKRRGVLQPVLVRPHAMLADHFELVFGARRLRAAKLAGIAELPAMVRELTDEEVLETQLVENAKRADIHPMEEAEAYERLHTKHKQSVDDIAAKCGKSRAYVYGRMKLLALPSEARAAFLEGKLTPSTALLVARIPVPELQVQATREIVEPVAGDEPMSTRDAARHIQNKYMLRLEVAPFDRANAELAGVGPCTTCPRRTGAQPELFADVGSPDLCTDPKCYERKREAHWHALVAGAKEGGYGVATKAESEKIFPNEYSTYPQGGYVELGKACYDDPEGRDWKTLMGKSCPPVTVAKDPCGGIHELVSEKAAREALRKDGHDWADESGDSSEDKAKAKAERALTLKTNALILDRVIEAAKKKLDTVGLLRMVIRRLANHCAASVNQVEKRRGIERGGFDEVVEKLNLSELGVLALELMVGDEYDTEARNDALELLSLDRKSIEKEAKAALAGEAKAAEKKVAAKAPKPEREIVVKKPKSKKSKGKKS